jgi:hypothetical protein
MEIYNERVSDLLSAEDKTIKIQEDMVCVMIILRHISLIVYLKI